MPTRACPGTRWGRSLLVTAGLCWAIARPLAAQHPLGYFAELGGNGGFASLNLDWRAAGHVHMRAGVGMLLWPTSPFTLSYVTGNGRSGLEIGGGATVFYFPPRDPDASPAEQFVELIAIGKGVGTVAAATGILGYRHESARGTVFRATVTPYYRSGKSVIWFGVSLGGAFR